MSANPWFRFFPSDWIAGVAGLSAAERGVYVTLLAMIYDNEAPVSIDDVRMARMCGIPVHGFRRALNALIELGKLQSEDGKIFNERAKSELTEREIRVDKAKAAASSSWENRKQKQCSKNSLADHEQSVSNATRARIPQPQSQEIDKSISQSALRTLADRFYRAYPKHVDPRDAEKRFIALVKRGENPESIIAAAGRYAEAHARAGTEKRFIQSPAVWLNKGGWLNEDLPAADARAGPPRKRNPFIEDLEMEMAERLDGGKDRIIDRAGNGDGEATSEFAVTYHAIGERVG